MAQSLVQRKGLVALGHKSGLSLLCVAILSIIIDRLLKGIGDPINVSDFAEATGSKREDIVDALTRLSIAGLIIAPVSFANVNSVSPSSLAIRLEIVEGLALNDTGTPRAPKTPKPEAAPAPVVQESQPEEPGVRRFEIGGIQYRARVYGINADNEVLAKACLTVSRLDDEGDEIATAYENTYVDDEAAWIAFENYVNGLAPSFERGEKLRIGENEYTVRVAEADNIGSGGKVQVYTVTASSGTVITTGTRDTEDEAWEAIEKWYRDQTGDGPKVDAPAEPKKSGRPKKAKA